MDRDETFWRQRYYRLANKIRRQGDTYRGVAATLRLRLNDPKEDPAELRGMIAQLDKASADMEYTWKKATHNLPQAIITEISATP